VFVRGYDMGQVLFYRRSAGYVKSVPSTVLYRLTGQIHHGRHYDDWVIGELMPKLTCISSAGAYSTLALRSRYYIIRICKLRAEARCTSTSTSTLHKHKHKHAAQAQAQAQAQHKRPRQIGEYRVTIFLVGYRLHYRGGARTRLCPYVWIGSFHERRIFSCGKGIGAKHVRHYWKI